jgi:hypothetical protein
MGRQWLFTKLGKVYKKDETAGNWRFFVFFWSFYLTFGSVCVIGRVLIYLVFAA